MCEGICDDRDSCTEDMCIINLNSHRCECNFDPIACNCTFNRSNERCEGDCADTTRTCVEEYNGGEKVCACRENQCVNGERTTSTETTAGTTEDMIRPCCLPGNNCLELDPLECRERGGTPHLFIDTCNETSCRCLPNECGLIEGECAVPCDDKDICTQDECDRSCRCKTRPVFCNCTLVFSGHGPICVGDCNNPELICKKIRDPTVACDARCSCVEEICIPFLPLPHKHGLLNPGCGNGIRENDEECDVADLDGRFCGDFLLDNGDLACYADCTFNFEGCGPLKPEATNQDPNAHNPDHPKPKGPLIGALVVIGFVALVILTIVGIAIYMMSRPSSYANGYNNTYTKKKGRGRKTV